MVEQETINGFKNKLDYFLKTNKIDFTGLLTATNP